MLKFLLPMLCLLLGLISNASLAAVELSAGLGANTAFASDVKYSNGGQPINEHVHWSGDSFKMPPYWNVRATYWLERYQLPNWGIAIDFTHAKVVADPKPAGFTTLEFTDGLNLLTFNALYDFHNQSRYTPYLGIGVGMSIPHVEVTTVDPLAASDTRSYQVAGVAANGIVGLQAKLRRNLSAYFDYKLSFSQNNTSFDQQTLDTNIWVNNFTLGLSYLLTQL